MRAYQRLFSALIATHARSAGSQLFVRKPCAAASKYALNAASSWPRLAAAASSSAGRIARRNFSFEPEYALLLRIDELDEARSVHQMAYCIRSIRRFAAQICFHQCRPALR